MPPSQSPSMPSIQSASPSKHWAHWIIIGLLVVSILGLVTLLLKTDMTAKQAQKDAAELVARLDRLEKEVAVRNESATESDNPKTVSQDSGTLEDELLGWKTYRNVRYGYTVQYPNGWYLDTSSSEKDFSPRGPEKTLMGGDTQFSNYPNPSDFGILNPWPKDFYHLNLWVYKIEPETTYNEFISSKYDKKDELNINGIPAVRLTETVNDPDYPSATIVATYIKAGGNMFVFHYSGDPAPPQEEEQIAQGIIGSFRTQ